MSDVRVSDILEILNYNLIIEYEQTRSIFELEKSQIYTNRNMIFLFSRSVIRVTQLYVIGFLCKIL